MPVSQKIEYQMQRISVNLTNDCDGNQLNYNNNLPAIGNKNYALQKPFETDFTEQVKLFATIILSWNLLISLIFIWIVGSIY